MAIRTFCLSSCAPFQKDLWSCCMEFMFDQHMFISFWWLINVTISKESFLSWISFFLFFFSWKTCEQTVLDLMTLDFAWVQSNTMMKPCHVVQRAYGAEVRCSVAHSGLCNPCWYRIAHNQAWDVWVLDLVSIE